MVRERRRVGAVLLTSLAAVALLALMAASASARFAPLQRSGPKLTHHVPRERLHASVTCSKGIRHAKREPVVLFPATGVDSEHNFSWNYERLFDHKGIPWCASDQPGKRSTNMDDLWVRSYYVTFAIRKAHRLAERKVAVLGHSQGGMIMRIGLRFWPDTRRLVDDVIGFAGTNHGTDGSALVCGASCPPANRQQGSDSRWTRALNSRAQTFKHISYTEVYTDLDEIVMPQPAASSVAGPGKITNVGIQDICPADTAEHLQIGTSDSVAAALAIDALGHRGPAKVSRIDSSVCSQPLQPGINPATYATNVSAAAAQLGASQAYPGTPSEPKVRCWAKLFPKACRRNRH